MKTPRYTDTNRYPHGYRKSTNTDVEATFRRVKQEQAKNVAERELKVQPLKRASK